MKLTAKELAEYEWPRQADCIVFDDDIAGFGLRCRGGRYSWVFQYAIGTGSARITRRIKIGDYPALSPVKARKEAEDLHAKVHLHGDPAIERRKNRIEAGNTFGKLAERYLEFKEGTLRRSSLREVKRHLELYAKPLHALSLSSIDQAAIARLLNTVAEGGPIAANRTRATLAAMFSWAMGEGLAASNPVINTNRRDEKSRDRVLSDDELRTIWHALNDDDFGIIVKLLMLTGQRAGEIAGLRWDEINFERGLVSIPGERTKNKRPHDVPMARTAHALLEARHRRGQRELVFGRYGGAFAGWSAAKRVLGEQIKLPHWTIHDLRRSAATGMAEIGIAPHVIEAVLNHVSGHKGGIAGIYNRAQYAAEKAQALARWDEHIGTVVEGSASKVVNLRGR